MKIAISTEDGAVSAHFGRCPAYTLAEVQGDEIRSHRVVVNPHFEHHVPGAVPQFLSGLQADVVLAGGMGPRAVAMFTNLGIEVATVERSIAREIGDRGRTGFGLFLLSWAALAEGAYSDADELLQEHEGLAPQIVLGRRVHGVFHADGTYQPPRALVRERAEARAAAPAA